MPPTNFTACTGIPITYDAINSAGFSSPTHGSAFMALMNTTSAETMLCSPLTIGANYEFYIDLCKSGSTFFPGKPILNIWGGDDICNKKELLWSGVPISNIVFTPYYVSFVPTDTHTYILFEGALGGGPDPFLALDNINNGTTSAFTNQNSDSEYFSIYPNPTIGLLKIQGYKEDIESIELYDIRGNRIRRYLLNRNFREEELDISFLDQGIYFLKAVSDYNSYMKKIVLLK